MIACGSWDIWGPWVPTGASVYEVTPSGASCSVAWPALTTCHPYAAPLAWVCEILIYQRVDSCFSPVDIALLGEMKPEHGNYMTKVLSSPCECPLWFQLTWAVCVLPIFTSWNPAPWGDGGRGRGLWEVTRSWGWSLREWDLCPIKDTQRASSLFPPGEVTWKGQPFMRKRISPDVMSAAVMIVDFSASKSVINKCVYCL